MTIIRNEIRTGLLVVVSLVVLVGVLIYLGAPGVFVAQQKLRIYVDNAAGIKPGAQVLLAGRKIGQVRTLFSPVPEKERPDPKLETIIEVQVEKSAHVYKNAKALLTQTSLLSETLIDFTSGGEASGLAMDGASFIGERPPGLAEAVPAVLAKIDPALTKVTETLDGLQKTVDNLGKITAEGSDLPQAFAEYKKFGVHLNDLTGPGGSLKNALGNVERMTSDEGKLGQALDHLSAIIGPDGSLAKTLKNTETFTANLAGNKDIDSTLRNFREASNNLKRTVSELSGQFSAVGNNLTQASDTVKHQPWRLIYPTTKKYPEDERRIEVPEPRTDAGIRVATPRPVKRRAR